TYGGDPDFAGSTTSVSPLHFSVAKADTSTAITLSGSGSATGLTAFTATVAVTAPGGGMPTGTIAFMDGATTLGTGTLIADPAGGPASASLTVPTLGVGSHEVTADYNGDANF